MRTIKFRVWVFESDIKEGYMLDIYERFDKDCNSDYYLVYEDFRDLEDGRSKHCIPLQFTGLHDKNGKEIYEGDICNVLYTDWPSKLESDSRTLDEYLNSISKKAILVWDYNQYKFHFKNSNGTSSLGSTIVGTYGLIEVIGNLYENPELLTD